MAPTALVLMFLPTAEVSLPMTVIFPSWSTDQWVLSPFNSANRYLASYGMYSWPSFMALTGAGPHVNTPTSVEKIIYLTDSR